MSMAWMRMPGQSRLAAAAAFLGMWVVMMVAMMLPALVPVLAKYRRALERHDVAGVTGLTALAGTAYFLVWAAYGAAAYAVGTVVVGAGVRWIAVARLLPAAAGCTLMIAGIVQLSPWKRRQLARCREAPACAPAVGGGAGWRHGLRLGVHCCLCCTAYMVSLLVAGVTNLGVTALVAAAITVERVEPAPARAARLAGAVITVAGALLLARALGVG